MTITEKTHAGEFILSEAPGSLSREQITVVSGQNLVAGAVVGIVTASSKYAEYDNGLVDGTETAVGVLFDAVDASSADAPGVVVRRLAEVSLGKLVWEGTASQGDKDAGVVDMANDYVIAR